MADLSAAEAQRLASEARDILRGAPATTFPVPIHDWAVRFGSDSTGDEAFWVDAVLDPERVDLDALPPGTYSDVTLAVLNTLRESGVRPGVWAYVAFLSLAETPDYLQRAA